MNTFNAIAFLHAAKPFVIVLCGLLALSAIVQTCSLVWPRAAVLNSLNRRLDAASGWCSAVMLGVMLILSVPDVLAHQWQALAWDCTVLAGNAFNAYICLRVLHGTRSKPF